MRQTLTIVIYLNKGSFGNELQMFLHESNSSGKYFQVSFNLQNFWEYVNESTYGEVGSPLFGQISFN